MRLRSHLALFTLATAAILSGCERRAPETRSRVDEPRPIAPAAKGIDAPPEAPSAAQ